MILLWFLIPAPKVLYENPGTILNNDYGQKAVYLTQDDVESIRSKGDLVFGYRDEKTQMLPYEGSVPFIEKVRSTVTLSLLAGVILCGIVIGIGVEHAISYQRNQINR